MKRGALRCVISWRQPESNNQRPFEEGEDAACTRSCGSDALAIARQLRLTRC